MLRLVPIAEIISSLRQAVQFRNMVVAELEGDDDARGLVDREHLIAGLEADEGVDGDLWGNMHPTLNVVTIARLPRGIQSGDKIKDEHIAMSVERTDQGVPFQVLISKTNVN